MTLKKTMIPTVTTRVLESSVIGKQKTMKVTQRLKTFYQDLSINSINTISSIYDDEVVFIDPVDKITGIAELKHYFTKLLSNTHSCNCDVTDVIEDVLDGSGTASLLWTMNFVHPKLNGGQSVNIEGASFIRFKHHKIIYHRDFYDLGEMLYEQIPLLKNLIGYVKKQARA